MSPRKNRKSLDDVLARQFIYGEKQHETLEEAAPKQALSEPSPEQLSSPDSESFAAQSVVNISLDAKEKTSSELPLMGCRPVGNGLLIAVIGVNVSCCSVLVCV